MNRLNTAVDDVRLGRKRFSISESLLPLLLLLVMFVTQTSARPQTANETTATHTQSSHSLIRAAPQKGDAIYNDESVAELAFDAGDEYADVDNVEWHHVKIVDGIMHEDHPIIMYKEDFVSEDYDPAQHASNEKRTNLRHQYHKKIKHQSRLNRTKPIPSSSSSTAAEKYHALKPEKIYFDILPQSPVVLTDDSSSNDSKLDAARIHVEVISLLDEQNEATKSATTETTEETAQKPSKELLNKHPKKYHHRRLRRDLAAVSNEHENAVDHVLHKRAPHYTYERHGANSFDDYAKHFMNFWTQKHPVAGNHWNGIDGDVPPVVVVDIGQRFGGEDNTDRVVWGVSKSVTRPGKPKPSLPSIFHNSNPENADFSPFATRRPQNNVSNMNNRRPMATTKRPVSQPQFPSIFHNSNPNDADFSGFTRPPVQRPTTTTAQPFRVQPQPVSPNVVSTGGEAPISQCVWAIVNCCSTTDSNIRYGCFERLGCRGAFWDLNPCADNVKNNILDFVGQQFQ